MKMMNCAIKKTPTPCLWQAPASTQHPENQKEKGKAWRLNE